MGREPAKWQKAPGPHTSHEGEEIPLQALFPSPSKRRTSAIRERLPTGQHLSHEAPVWTQDIRQGGGSGLGRVPGAASVGWSE